MQRGSTPHDKANDALGRIDMIVGDSTTAPAYKLIALMHEAVTARNENLPTTQPTDQLFGINPSDACALHFKKILAENAATLGKHVSTAFPINITPDVAQDLYMRPQKDDDVEIVIPTSVKTSVLHTAQVLKTKKSEQFPEMKNFMELLKTHFPKELATDKKFEKDIEEQKKQDRKKALLCREGKIKTHAFDIYASRNKTASQKYIELMHNAAEAFKIYTEEFQTAERLEECYGNHELDTSLYLMNTTHMLYNHEHNVVYPDRIESVIIENKMVTRTPLEYAQDIGKTFPVLGQFFENRLTKHQKRLDVKENNGGTFPIKGKKAAVVSMSSQQRLEAQ